MTEGLAERLARIRDRIGSACARSGRVPEDVTLIGAAKRQPDDRITAAHDASLCHFGENIVQEAEAHHRLLASSRADSRLVWHLIGPLQSNKVAKAVRLFDWIHSVDRLKIARLLDREAARQGKALEALLEVNLDNEPTKHGFAVDQLPEILPEVLTFEHLRIGGLMAIPPPATAERDSRRWFRRLRELRDEFFSSSSERGRGYLSMGMSGDFESAIEEGATHVRIGSILFGLRAPR